MRIKLAPAWLLVGFLLASAAVQADSLVEGDAAAGKAKAITCTACHGAEGNSVNPEWPNIAGQHAGYTVDQLQAFKSGKRQNALMSSQAMLLTDQDMADLAVYFESLPAAAQAVADPDLLVRGEALYRGGDLEKGVSACLACHGPTGKGNPAAGYPLLAGQHAVYTAKALNDYASGARAYSHASRMMQEIAVRLDNEDIEALSSYIQGLRQ